MRLLLSACLLLLATACFAFAPTLLLSFEGNATGTPGGAPVSTAGAVGYVAGHSGQAVSLPEGAMLTYAARGVLDKSRGAVAFWLRPNWNGDDGRNHALLADVSNFDDKLQNTFTLWKWSTGQLRLDLRSPADPYLTYDVRHWRAGQWHHVGASWDAQSGLALFVDGQCVARREATYEPQAWPKFNLGGDWRNAATGDATFDELRLYNVPLEAAHMAALKQELPLEQAAVTKLAAPPSVTIGTPFVLQAEVSAPQPLTRDYPLVVLVDGVEVGRAVAEPPAAKWQAKPRALQAIAVTIPSYLRIYPGRHTITLQLEGAVQAAPEKPAIAEVFVLPAATAKTGHSYEIGRDGAVRRDGEPFPPSGAGEGFLYDGVFYTADEAGRARARELIGSGLIKDAFPCRLVDAVDCATDSHGLREWGKSVVEEIGGRSFRITGPRDTVDLQVDVYGRKTKALPGFAFTLANTALPRPHVLVAELPNDRERYTEIAVDAAPGSRLATHLGAAGPGDTRLINLATVYTGREYPCDGSVLRHSLVFFPKSDACEVTITSSGREKQPTPTSGAAVARLAVYELLDDEAALYNPVALPDHDPQRSVSLFFPEHSYLYTQWGFSGLGDQQRRASILGLFDYMKLIGANRLEFHPVGFGMSCYYNGGALPNAGKYDVFDDLLPLAEERGMQVVPALDGMAFYDKFPEFTDESFQLDRDGKSIRKYFGKVPDPLRPEVQARLMGFLSEFLEKCRASKAVPMVSFKADGKMGTCYSGDSREHPAEDAGYSEWDLKQFEQATGLTVGGTPGDAPSRYEWLAAQPERWAKWMDWRCRATHDFWLKCRDLAVSRGMDSLLIKTILPDNLPGQFNFWQQRKRSPLEVVRGHGYEPSLYAREKGLRFTRCLLVGSDRYFGEEANKTWQYDDSQAGFYKTAEGTETELYFVYWELPDHPLGFRVGPSSGPGRAFFEPLTYTLRMHNPYNLTFYNWYPGTLGHELDLRRFVRAYRALPAVAPRDFEGQVFPRDERIVARWFGHRLAIINDTNRARKVRLTLPEVLPPGATVTDLGSGVALPQVGGPGRTRLELQLQAWDIATLEIIKPSSSRTR